MSLLKELLILARPHHYLKNGFVWLPAFFGYRLTDKAVMLATLWAFLVFCLTASTIYVINDIKDAAADRMHPRKKERPIARGAVNVSQAIVFSCILLAAALILSVTLLPERFLAIVCGYLVLNLGYTFYLKHLAIIDVLCVALGFVLRITGGGIAAGVALSHWIILMTFLIAIYLSLGKRRDDLLLSHENDVTIRRSLDGYNLEFVSQSMTLMTSVVVIVYILYTVSPETQAKHGTNNIYTTCFWVICGILRYMQVSLVKGKGGSPTRVLIKDRILWVIIAGWLLHTYWLLYGF